MILFALLEGVSLLELYSLSSYFDWHSDSFQSLSKDKLMQLGGNSSFLKVFLCIDYYQSVNTNLSKVWLNSHLQEMFWKMPVYWRRTTYFLIPEATQNTLQTTHYPSTESGHRLLGDLLQKGVYIFGFQCLWADLPLACWTCSLTEREQCGFLTMPYHSENEQVEATLDSWKGCFVPNHIKIVIL